jgi:hypothetical protein
MLCLQQQAAKHFGNHQYIQNQVPVYFLSFKKNCLVILLHQTTTQDARKKEMRPTLNSCNSLFLSTAENRKYYCGWLRRRGVGRLHCMYNGFI